MNYRNTLRFVAGAFCTVLLSNYFVNQANAAIPPAQGPPAASQNAQSVAIDGLTGVLTVKIDSKVAAKNASLATDPSHRAVISASIQAHTPFMTASTYPNKPNQFLAEVQYTVTYRVSNIQVNVLGEWVPYPFDRFITQEIDLDTTCEGWYTQNGALTYTAVPYPANVEGDHSFLEDALGALLLEVIPNYVDSVISQSLGDFSSAASSFSAGAACRSLGVSTKAQGFPYDAINYDQPHFPIIPLPQIQVSVAQVRRMQVRSYNGTPVYNPVEAPRLDFYAGFSYLHIQLPPMVEGQTVNLTQGNTVETPLPPVTGSLVVIANLSSGNDNLDADYAFRTFGSPTFGNGPEIMYIPKHWIQPSPGPDPKMVTVSAPGYEITLQVTTPAGQGAAQ
jgi:hypothetical protein